MKWNEGTSYEQPEAGTHVARCFKLVDLGTQPVEWQGTIKHQRKVQIVWELSEAKMQGTYNPELKGQPFAVSRKYTQSLDPRSRLRADLESWRGKKYSKEDIEKFDPRSLLGKACLISLIESDDATKVYVDRLSAVPKATKVPKQINKTVYFSLDPEEFDPKVFEALPDRTKEKIKASREYRELVQSESQPDPSTGEPMDGEPPEGDDDLPF